MFTILRGMTVNYATVAFRNLYRHKTTALINISGLAIGIACCILAIAFVGYHLSWNATEHQDRIFRVLWATPKDGRVSSGTSGPLAQTLEATFPEVERAIRINLGNAWVMTEKGAFRTGFDTTDPSIFDFFGYQLLLGNKETVFRSPHSVVVTASTAERVFGTQDVVGKTVDIESYMSTGDYTITGVIADPPPNMARQLRPTGFLTATQLGTRSADRQGEARLLWEEWQTSGFRGMHTFIRLRSPKDTTALESKLGSFITDTMGEEAGQTYAYRLQPLTDMHLFGADYGLNTYRARSLFLVGGISTLILLVACINSVNLSTAHAWIRQKEVGIRKSCGASRKDVCLQFMLESFVATTIAALAGIGLANLALPLFRAHSGLNLPDSAVSADAYLIAAVLAITVALLGGIYPSLVISSFHPARALKSKSVGAGGARFRWVLSTAQFVTCILLILGTAVMIRQTQFMMQQDLGFDRDLMITMPIFAEDRDRKPDYGQHLSYKWRMLKAEVIKHPNVLAASAFNGTPGLLGSGTSIVETEGKRKRIQLIRGDADYFDFFSVPIIHGRKFDPTFGGRDLTQGKDHREFILNESAVRLFGWDKPESGGPLGKTFNLRNGGWEPNGTVVGVVKDFHIGDLKRPIGPLAMLYSVHILTHLSVKVKPERLDETITFLRTFWETHLPERPFKYAFLDEQIANRYRQEKQTAALINDFSILAILLGCMGLFGLTTFVVERKVKEIGIRKSLGATVTNIVILLSRESGYILLAANLIAWPIGFILLKDWLSQFVYRIDLHMGYFMLSGLTAGVIALLTVALQAIPAARANPVDALRDE